MRVAIAISLITKAGRLFGHLTQASDESGVGGGERFRLFRNYPLQFSVLAVSLNN